LIKPRGSAAETMRQVLAPGYLLRPAELRHMRKDLKEAVIFVGCGLRSAVCAVRLSELRAIVRPFHTIPPRLTFIGNRQLALWSFLEDLG